MKHHRELGVPWTDPAFPPSNAPAFPQSDVSVGASKVRQLGRKVEWKRPSESTQPNVTESSRFVFVPSPANPGSANIFPGTPLPVVEDGG